MIRIRFEILKVSLRLIRKLCDSFTRSFCLPGNKTYDDSEGRVKLLENKEKNIPKGILQIDEVTMEDRNMYTCGASNIASKFTNATESTTFVRVKDKLAALWPFLGICAEVVVLCTIILIYEKKRNKTELDESDTDGSPEQLSWMCSLQIKSSAGCFHLPIVKCSTSPFQFCSLTQNNCSIKITLIVNYH